MPEEYMYSTIATWVRFRKVVISAILEANARVIDVWSKASSEDVHARIDASRI